MTLIRRAEDDLGELFAWWDGGELTADSQFLCGPDEVAFVLDERTEVLAASLGPGRHGLPAALGRYVDGAEVLVIFVTTSPVKIEAEGVLDDHPDQPWVEVSAAFTAGDPQRALELLPRLDDDESPEDFLADELMLAVAEAAGAHGGALAALQDAQGALAARAQVAANAALAELGLTVRIDQLELSESEAD
jgi:hypothetical protein